MLMSQITDDEDVDIRALLVLRMEECLKDASQFVEVAAITNANVPILKLKHKELDIECDICVRKHIGKCESVWA